MSRSGRRAIDPMAIRSSPRTASIYAYVRRCCNVCAALVNRSNAHIAVMIEIRELGVVYPNGVEALRGASLVVRPSEIVVLLGPSGSGKSTLLRCINGLQPVTSGSITVDGANVAALSGAGLADLRRSIGFIWQGYNVVKRRSVFTNVRTGRLGHRRGLASLLHIFGSTDRQIAVRSLERVNLLDRAHQRADQLSGGETQRVAIARALPP